MKKELENIPPRFAGDPEPVRSTDKEIRFDGYVLVGGASSRMGRDKAQMVLGGKRLFERAADALSGVCDGIITLVGREVEAVADGSDYKLKAVSDIGPDSSNDVPRAPIAGLYTALATATTDWIVVLACDLPFAGGELMTHLARFCLAEFDAVVPVQPDGRPQPLCAFYRRQKCLSIAGDRLKMNDLKLQRFLSQVSTRYVEFAEIADLSGSEQFFLNVNEPKDFEAALRIS